MQPTVLRGRIAGPFPTMNLNAATRLLHTAPVLERRVGPAARFVGAAAASTGTEASFTHTAAPISDSAERGSSVHVAETSTSAPEGSSVERQRSAFELSRLNRKAQRAREAATYKASAVAATTLVATIAVVATYLRFTWHMQADGRFPVEEMAATLLLVLGGVFGMEMYARFAHKVLWHDFEPGWALHKSHHEPRTGPFELNDIYAVANAVPAMALCAYGFMTPNLVGGVCFGAGLGITLFGIMYMFVHDGLVHKRFPVGPIAELPYLKEVTVAHQIHHTGKFGGAPWGMFLGPQELDAIPGGREELNRMLAELEARSARVSTSA